MLTKSMKVFRLIYRVVVSLFRVLTIVPTALSAFFRGDTIEEFCGLVDPLTGLKNKKCLERYLKTRTDLIGVLFLDVDHFKAVNDTFGHHVGDQYLIRIANTLNEAIDGHGHAYRVGGDEIIIVSNQHKYIDSLEAQVRAYLKSHLGVPISIGKSLGDRASVIKLADMRMYKHKFNKKDESDPSGIRGVVFLAHQSDRRSSVSYDRRANNFKVCMN